MAFFALLVLSEGLRSPTSTVFTKLPGILASRPESCGPLVYTQPPKLRAYVWPGRAGKLRRCRDKEVKAALRPLSWAEQERLGQHRQQVFLK